MIVFPKAKKKTSFSNKVNLSFWYLSNLFCFFCCFAETNCKADQFQNLKEGVDILSKLWSSIKLPIVLWNLKKKVAFNTNVDDYFLLLKILFFHNNYTYPYDLFLKGQRKNRQKKQSSSFILILTFFWKRFKARDLYKTRQKGLMNYFQSLSIVFSKVDNIFGYVT